MAKSANPQKPFITLHFSVKIVVMKAYVFSAGLKTNTSQVPCFVELDVTVLCDKHTIVARILHEYDRHNSAKYKHGK